MYAMPTAESASENRQLRKIELLMSGIAGRSGSVHHVLIESHSSSSSSSYRRRWASATPT